MIEHSYCKRHNTFPEDGEPCWQCVNTASAADQITLAQQAEQIKALKRIISARCDFHHIPITDGWAHQVKGAMVRCRLTEEERAALEKE